MSIVSIVGFSGLGVLVLAWLLVSFSQPSSRRAIIEWIGATAMYVALLSLFVNLLTRSLAQESTVGMIAFGFLVTFFSVGLVLCLVQTISSLRGAEGSESSVTN
jgi:protein-S-isoprenylcysteine O-methyltransferase Ste14